MGSTGELAEDGRDRGRDGDVAPCEADVLLVGAELAYERIRQAIVEGRYRPGQRLVEKRVGDELDLSRTPVREALQRLEAEGLVQSVRNRGAVVRTLTADDIVEIYELRARLESLATECAAMRRTEQGLRELEAANTDFRLALVDMTPGDLAGLRLVHDANNRFHDGLVAMAGNWRLKQLLARTVHAPLVFLGFRQYGRAELERSLLFHDLMFNAVATGQATRAGNLMAEHIYLGRESLLAHLGDAETLAPLLSESSSALDRG
jgi:DNA-binding GntR family transcriptional regulator